MGEIHRKIFTTFEQQMQFTNKTFNVLTSHDIVKHFKKINVKVIDLTSLLLILFLYIKKEEASKTQNSTEEYVPEVVIEVPDIMVKEASNISVKKEEESHEGHREAPRPIRYLTNNNHVSFFLFLLIICILCLLKVAFDKQNK